MPSDFSDAEADESEDDDFSLIFELARLFYFPGVSNFMSEF